MELIFKISTDESMTLAEAKELTEQSQAENLTPSELAVDLIREGLRRRREVRASDAETTSADSNK